MDLALYARVLSRHSAVLLIGCAVAFFLATTSYYRVTVDGVLPEFTPRKAEIWQSQANVYLTEKGFPAGSRAQYNNASRFTGLTGLYARLAQSDQVLKRIERSGPLPGAFQAAPVVDTTAGPVPLPVVALFGKAGSPARAKETLARGLNGFLGYVRANQVAAGIPESQRIELRIINAPESAILIEPRKKTLPVVVFLAVMIAAVAVVFILENASRNRTGVPLEALPELRDSSRQESELLPEPLREPRATPAPELRPEPRPARAPELSAEQPSAPEPESEPAPVRRWA